MDVCLFSTFGGLYEARSVSEAKLSQSLKQTLLYIYIPKLGATAPTELTSHDYAVNLNCCTHGDRMLINKFKKSKKYYKHHKKTHQTTSKTSKNDEKEGLKK